MAVSRLGGRINGQAEAEKLIYEALEASELDGLALYEVKPLSSAPQLDFAVWLLDVGTFGIQTKGGRYIIIDGEWYLVTGLAVARMASRSSLG